MEEFLIQNEQLVIWLIAALLFGLFAVPFWIKKIRLEKHTHVQDIRAEEFGLKEPVSLYPKVNPDICIGSAGCVAACPEEDVLGIRNGQGVAVNKALCIGHGLCERACPVDAITLVFGSKTRGVDIPRIRENFETNVPGIHIVGELGGMGLIQNAFEQARQCIEYIRKDLKPSGRRADSEIYDLLIIGCGPAGLSATIHAKRAGYHFKTLEREGIGGTVRYYPRKKLVLTNPLDVPGVGKIHKKQILKEELIEVWESIVEKQQLDEDIVTGVNVDEIRRVMPGGVVVGGDGWIGDVGAGAHSGDWGRSSDGGAGVVGSGDGKGAEDAEDAGAKPIFELICGNQTWRCRKVLIAVGRRGTPRKLGIPGEELDNVAYSLLEPDHYTDESIMVVGGGDSAIEAALALSEQPGNQVSISYRKEKFSRLKPLNRLKLNEALEEGRIVVYRKTNVIENRKDSVVLQHEDGREEVMANNSLFVFAGGILPTAFLEKAGIRIDTKFGEA